MDNVVHAMPRGPCTPQFTEYDSDMDISKCIVHVIRPCCVQSHGCLRQRTVPFIQETITSRSLSLFHCSLLPCKIKKSINLFPFHFSCKNVPKPRSKHKKKKIPWTNKFMSNVFIFFFSVQFAARVIRWYPKWNPNQNYGYFDTDHIEKHWTSKFHWLIVTNRPAILIKLSYELQANWTMHGKV